MQREVGISGKINMYADFGDEKKKDVFGKPKQLGMTGAQGT